MTETATLSTLLLLFFSSGLGLPVGVPPQPEDPYLSQVAPDNCLFYTSWSAMGDAQANSANATERMMADPELQQLVTELEARLTAAAARAAAEEADRTQALLAQMMPTLMRSLLTRQAAIYVAEVDIERQHLRGCAVAKLGDDRDRIRTMLLRLQTEILGQKPQPAQVQGIEFFAVPTPEGPPVHWGLRDDYFILAVGEGAIEELLVNSKSPAPKWFTQIQSRLPVKRRSTISYVNLAELLKLAKNTEPSVAFGISVLDLDKLTDMVAVSGLDEGAYVVRSEISFEGEASGLLQLAEAPALGPGDLAHIPNNAQVALCGRLDSNQLLTVGMDLAQKFDPQAAQEIETALEGLETALGFDVRQDLLQTLGDSWSVYTSPESGGLLTGWLATVNVRDHARLSATHILLLDLLKSQFSAQGNDIELGESKFLGNTIHYVKGSPEEFPFSPSWCLTKDRFLIGLSPQAIKAQLRRQDDASSLAQRPEVNQMLADSKNALTASYVDMKYMVETFYPLLQLGMTFIAQEMPEELGVDFDTTMLPSPAALTAHIQPAVGSLRRTSRGLELYSRQTLPGGNMLASAPISIALLLPAVQSARGAAVDVQSLNNMKQIALALHNHADTHRGLPALYNVDEQGKPLLSWRVHILPYIEQRALYEEFRLDEPWDSPHNKALIPRMPEVFRRQTSPADFRTNYLAVSGKNSALRPAKKGYESPTGFRDIIDGTSNTAWLIEVSGDQRVTWTQPDDFVYDPKDAANNVNPSNDSHVFLGMVDGSVQRFQFPIRSKILKALFESNDGEVIPWEELYE